MLYKFLSKKKLFGLLDKYIKEKILLKEIIVASLSDLETEIPFLEFSNAYVVTRLIGQEINPIGTSDNDNTSDQDANLINDNLTDLVYNNTSSGSANKSLPAIDLGEVKDVGYLRLYWWSNSFTATNFSIQGSNNGTDWTDLKTNLNSLDLDSKHQDIEVNAAHRFFRVFCITGNNPTWCVLSEMLVYAKGDLVNVNIFNVEDLQVLEANGKLAIKNVSKKDYNVKIVTR